MKRRTGRYPSVQVDTATCGVMSRPLVGATGAAGTVDWTGSSAGLEPWRAPRAVSTRTSCPSGLLTTARVGSLLHVLVTDWVVAIGFVAHADQVGPATPKRRINGTRARVWRMAGEVHCSPERCSSGGVMLSLDKTHPRRSGALSRSTTQACSQRPTKAPGKLSRCDSTVECQESVATLDPGMWPTSYSPDTARSATGADAGGPAWILTCRYGLLRTCPDGPMLMTDQEDAGSYPADRTGEVKLKAYKYAGSPDVGTAFVQPQR